MSGDRKNGSDSDLKIRVILRAAIAVVASGIATVLMFMKLTSTTLIVSYKQAELSLESAPAALMDEIIYSLLIGLATGVVVLVLIFGVYGRIGDEDDKKE